LFRTRRAVRRTRVTLQANECFCRTAATPCACDDGVIDDAQKKPRSAGLMTVYFSRIA
jgi:hypothetical protein